MKNADLPPDHEWGCDGAVEGHCGVWHDETRVRAGDELCVPMPVPFPQESNAFKYLMKYINQAEFSEPRLPSLVGHYEIFKLPLFGRIHLLVYRIAN